jgi:hypothetical protein
MDDSKISEAFIERMVGKVIEEITGKLDELDLSLDYIAAALLDSGELSIAARQKGVTRGRGAQIARAGAQLARTASASDKDST